MGAVKNHFWNEINRVRCAECGGNPALIEGPALNGKATLYAYCEHCHGEGECDCLDCCERAA